MGLRILFGAVALACSVNALAGGSLDVSLASDAVRLEYDAAKADSGLHVSLAGMHHETDGDLLSVAAHVVDMREPSSPLYLGVGGRLFIFKQSDYNSGALGLGGFFRYQITDVPGLSVAGYGYYAPSVVAFNDTESLLDSDLRVQYGLLPTARVYMGYRYTGIKVEGVSKRVELEQGIHFGLKVDF